jgi:ubiquinone/menaquinone biosynthesis C-methylase UbiE
MRRPMATETLKTAGGDPERQRKITERIRANFDRGAGDYARFEAKRAFFAALTADLLALRPLPRGARVLDVGCGTGASLEGLAAAAAGTPPVGVDVSLGMLRAARDRLGPGALLVQGDGCRLDGLFRPAFDAVFYNAVLFMIPDGAGSLESALRVLRPGGAVYASLLEGACCFPDGETLPAMLSRRGLSVGTHSPTPAGSAVEAMERLFRPVLKAVREVEMDRTVFLDFYGMEPMSAGLMPALAFPERRAALESFAGDHFGGGGRVVQRWLLAVGQKNV